MRCYMLLAWVIDRSDVMNTSNIKPVLYFFVGASDRDCASCLEDELPFTYAITVVRESLMLKVGSEKARLADMTAATLRTGLPSLRSQPWLERYHSSFRRQTALRVQMACCPFWYSFSLIVTTTPLPYNTPRWIPNRELGPSVPRTQLLQLTASAQRHTASYPRTMRP